MSQSPNKFCTVVVRMPTDEAGKAAVRKAMDLLQPHQTGMSLEDEMTRLDLITEHEDFPSHISEEVDQKLSEMTAAA